MKFSMRFNVLLLSAILLTTHHALALDTSKCPTAFEAEISNVTAYATSVYQKEAGWLEARDALQTLKPQTLTFSLQTRTASACTYVEAGGASARLFPWKYWDAEDGRDHVSDRLLLEFAVGDTLFTVFPEVESYDVSSLALFSQNSPQRLKVRTKLLTSSGKRIGFDVGLAHVATK